MTVTFEYRLQIEAKGKTALGRDIAFLVEAPFINTVETVHHSHETGRIVNEIYTENFEFKPLDIMINPALQDYCKRHSIIIEDVSILTYTIQSMNQDVVIYFNPSAPQKRTDNPAQQIYAYLIGDLETPPAPTEVTAEAGASGIVLSWLISGHYHGVRIYDEHQELIASLGADTYEWVDHTAKAGQLKTYYVASYHSKGESSKVAVTGRIEKDIDLVIPVKQENRVVTRKAIAKEEVTMKAFQSGIGDADDLKVAPSASLNKKETFSYSMQVKGYEEKVVQTFPSREFQYRILAHNPYGIEIAKTPWRVGVIDGKLPYTENNSGKESVRTPMDIEIPPQERNVQLTVEIMDPSGMVKLDMDKGVPPVTTFIDDYLTFSSRPEAAEEQLVKTPYYGELREQKKEFTVKCTGSLNLEDQIPSPLRDPIFKDKQITEWLILLKSSNPNVHLAVTKYPDNFLQERNSLSFGMRATIINIAQAPWHVPIHSGYYYLNQAEHYLHAQTNVKGLVQDQGKIIVHDNEVFVAPIPKPNAPIIVRDASYREMTQTFFYDGQGKPTLDYTEELVSNHLNEVLLSYPNVDANTLVLSGQMPDGTWRSLTDYSLIDNYLKLYPSIKPESKIRATYRLRRSFTVDYDWDTADGYARILLHDAILNETQEVDVFYETADDPYYVADKIDLNPIRNTQNAGFIYLANQTEPCKEIELELNQQTLYATGKDSIYIRAVAKDRFGNPVVGEDILFATTGGTAVQLTNVSDINGMVTAKYIAPTVEGSYEIWATDVTNSVKAMQVVHVKAEEVGSHISLSTSHPVVYPNLNEVTVTAYVYGENQEPIIGTDVHFEYDSGIANKQMAVTNQFGAASIVFAATEIPRSGIIRIRAVSKTLNLQEDTILRILGFRYYHPSYFMTGNNLIDAYDRAKARDNLGITAGSQPPKDPKEFDLWMDQGDLLFLQQTYQLRDIEDRNQARQNLGITQSSDAPEQPWNNDIWIDE